MRRLWERPRWSEWQKQVKLQLKERNKLSKINTFIPEPKEEYNIENQRLINLAITQIIQKLNFSYQQEIKNDQQAFEYFLS